MIRRIAVDQARLVDGVRRQATESLAAAGFTLASFDVHPDTHGPRSVGVQAVRGVQATSRDPLVAGVLLAFRNQLEAVEREHIDLAGELSAGMRIADLRRDVGAELVLTARLA